MLHLLLLYTFLLYGFDNYSYICMKLIGSYIVPSIYSIGELND